jgi:hypothetical protein
MVLSYKRAALAAWVIAASDAFGQGAGASAFKAGDVWTGVYRCDNRQSEFTLRITGSGVARTSYDGPPPITVAAEIEPKGGVTFPVFGVLRAGNPLTLRPVESRLPPGAVPFGLNASLEREGRALVGTVVRPGCEAFTMTRAAPGTHAGSDPMSAGAAAATAPAIVAGSAGAGRAPSILDFLPKGVLISEDECRRGLQEAMAWAQRMVWQGRMQVQGDSWVQAVPPHWASFSQMNPELGIWTQENAPRGCPGRTKLRAWLRAIGEPAADIDQPGSTAGSVPVLRQARQQLAAANAELAAARRADEERFRAEAQRTAQAQAGMERSLDLETLAMGSPMAQVKALLPAALCTGTEAVVRCKRAEQCSTERTALRRVEERMQALRFRATRPSDREDIQNSLREAMTALDRCNTVYDMSAAARSFLSFGEQTVRYAELRFERGVLDAVEFSGTNDPRAIRDRLTRRYGAPSVAYERIVLPTLEVELQDRIVTAWDRQPWDPPVGHVATEETLVQGTEVVNVPRETWEAPGLAVVQYRGRFSVYQMQR